MKRRLVISIDVDGLPDGYSDADELAAAALSNLGAAWWVPDAGDPHYFDAESVTARLDRIPRPLVVDEYRDAATTPNVACPWCSYATDRGFVYVEADGYSERALSAERFADGGGYLVSEELSTSTSDDDGPLVSKCCSNPIELPAELGTDDWLLDYA